MESVTPREIILFSCLLCSSSNFYGERQYFEHLGNHLRRFEEVACVFKNCKFSTSIHSIFATHRHRKYTPHAPEEFNTEVLDTEVSDPIVAQGDSVFVEDEDDPEEPEDLSQVIKEKFCHLFLKLERTFSVPNN